ncbi:MAG: M28 family peptidase [Phenylobacterium sp.]|uniref:M28 family peptidase n=1 Tax=Phenylobacterium sp. TaxID=1871053 RepID=UPI0017E4BD1B|nr:M28 family peptidase [Phenylobacterium sp.]MBA4794563.1 M28 family peptidase [Phenylobacterium sp.]
MTTRLLAACLFAATTCLTSSAWAAPGDRALQDVQVLAADEMQGRATGTDGAAAARIHILQRFAEIGVQPAYGRFQAPFVFASADGASREGVNLVGQIPGRGPGPVLLITAHYDHLGVKDGEIFNGADDNASGVAGLLAIAEAFAEEAPRHTVLFAVLDAEELGLAGAKALAANPPVPLSQIALAINLDMISKSAEGELYAAGAAHFPWLRPRLEAVAAAAPVQLRLGHDGPPWTGHDDWSEASDHAALGAAGVPWAYFGVEDHPEYHQPTDDVGGIPRDFFADAVATVVLAARRFDAELSTIAEAAKRPAPSAPEAAP